jgi:hypothetical protein
VVSSPQNSPFGQLVYKWKFIIVFLVVVTGAICIRINLFSKPLKETEIGESQGKNTLLIPSSHQVSVTQDQDIHSESQEIPDQKNSKANHPEHPKKDVILAKYPAFFPSPSAIPVTDSQSISPLNSSQEFPNPSLGKLQKNVKIPSEENESRAEGPKSRLGNEDKSRDP